MGWTAGDNPLLTAYRDAVGRGEDPQARATLVTRFAFAVPVEEALDVIRLAAPDGLVEIGAGTGYWARLLSERGVVVSAFDPAPAGSSENQWFANSVAWFDVQRMDHTVVDDFGRSTLLLVWPTLDEEWAADAIGRFAAAGGQTVVHVGEPSGGRTGDDAFHALLGETDRCWACAYEVHDRACVCGVVPLFRCVETVEIPQWSGFHDEVRVYRRDEGRCALGREPKRARRRRFSTAARRTPGRS